MTHSHTRYAFADRDASDITSLATRELVELCGRERARYQSGDAGSPEFGLELFRRAVCQSDADAWAAIVAQYRGLVLAWIQRHPASRSVCESDDYWVTSTFERFWTAVKADRWAQFADLAALLRYLKMCAHCTVLDAARARRWTSTGHVDDDSGAQPSIEGVDDEVLDEIAAGELWRVIQRLLPNRTEQLLAELSFVGDLQPREIHARHPDAFESVSDVYRVKRNVIERLRRSTEIRRLMVA